MFFRKTKPTMVEADPTKFDLEGVAFQHLVLKQKLIEVNLELMRRYITIVVASKELSDVDPEREGLKRSAEECLKLHLALKGETFEEFKAGMPEWYS